MAPGPALHLARDLRWAGDRETLARLLTHKLLALAAPTWLTHAERGPKVPRPN